MNKHKQLLRGLGRRSMACLLALVLMLGLVPITGLRAGAISVDEAVQKVVDWGFMRGDISGNMRPDDPITRAEFVTIINRAFGYHVMGEDPFTDVTASDWYAQDVSIAYTENYITGTSDTTFSPNGQLTREQAVVILARNMRLQAYPGEDTSFSDSRDLHEWSRGLVEQAVRYNIVNGYPDGTFRPAKAITRGEAATLLVNAIGNPVQEAGVHTLNGVYGNVTITASGVTLRDTVVAGNLYITDGVDLGSVLLENVRVLGQIVICGGGVSQDGNESIVLRNVDAQELIIDTIRGQEVSVRVDGDGTIASTTVRTNAFLRDNTGDGQGLLKITLDGGEKAKLSLAGNIKQVINITPNSTLNLVSGTAASITIDEAATGSTLNIAAGALADEVNLDVATTVTGEGDIGKLTVNSSGSTVTMLPDEIIVRPGDTVTIGGEEMDSNEAAEASSDPRLMGGYPNVSDLAPTSALAKFSGNKAGTVYWAVTPITSGSVGAGDLINPPSYNNDIVKSGTTTLTGSGVVASAKLDKLTSGGSYYLSAVFVDAREDQSPVKVISFSTPDDTVPNFADGYPYLSRITSMSAQVTVMPTKTCQLYYALLPKGATAPTGDDFKAGAGAIPGNLGYGSMSVTKNTTYSFDVNNQPLKELESYDLYLWLSDLEGGKSSAVKKLSFTTVDGTPPVFNTEPTVNKVDKTSVGLYANLNEDGTLYWVVVNHGETYPKPLAGQSGAVDLGSDNAKLQVSAGMNALKSGKVNMTEGKDVSFTISGLEEEKSYDLYYVAQDKAGNYSAKVGMMTIHTLDSNAPTVTQEFTKYNGTDTTRPLPESDVRLVFSEAVQTNDTYTPLVDLYKKVTEAAGSPAAEDVARDNMATALSNAIYLYEVPAGMQPEKIEGATAADKESGNWVIDYRYAEITTEEGKTVITFPNSKGINLKSGATYYFEIQADTIADTSSAANVMGRFPLAEFTTVFAIVNLSALNENSITSYTNSNKEEVKPESPIPVDVSWRLNPVSTEKVVDSIDWDMLIWCDTSVEFNLYARETGSNDANWEFLGNKSITVPGSDAQGISLTRGFRQSGTTNPDFEALNTLDEDVSYDFAISFTKVAGLADRNTWSQRLNLKIHVLAGSNNELGVLSANVTEENFKDALEEGSVTNIGQPEDFSLRKQFTDLSEPEFIGDYPTFDAGDSAVNMSLMLDRPGTVYYVVAPLGYIGTTDESNNEYKADGSTGEGNWETLLPDSGIKDPPELKQPDYLNIVNASTYYRNPKIKYGSVTCGSSVEVELVEGLDKETKYIAYFVLQGTSQTYSRVLAYRFKTTDVAKPKLTLNDFSPSVKFETDSTANVKYALVASDQIPNQLKDPFENYVDSEKKNAWEEYKKTISASTNATVLWALQTRYKDYTVFDEFAGAGIRKTVEEFVSGVSSMGVDVANRGSTELTQANGFANENNFTSSMKGATYYYCLATAVSPLGSETSFAAVAGIHIRDSEPPKLTNVKTAATGKIGTDGNIVYSGTVIFIFDEPIYQLVTVNGIDQEPKEVWQTKYYADPDVAVRLKDIMGVSQSKDKFTYPNDIKAAASTLSLDFKDIPIGTTIVLFDTSYICDVNSNSTRQRLTFTLQLDEQGAGVPMAGFVQQEPLP